MALPTLEDYAALVRRHLVLMAVGVLLGTAGGVAYLRSDPLTYTATAEVLLGRLPAHTRIDPSVRDPRLVTIDTDAAIVRSRLALGAVAEATGLEVTRVQQELTVDAEPLTQVLRVSFTDPQAETAERGADVAAETLLELRGNTLYKSRARQERRLERRLERLTDRMDALRIKGEPYNAPLASLKRRLESQYALVHQQLELGPDAGRVLVDAERPTRATRVNPEVRIASGAMLGLLAGLGVGLLRDVRRRAQGPPPRGPRTQPVPERRHHRRVVGARS